jgi:hypothetical protein
MVLYGAYNPTLEIEKEIEDLLYDKKVLTCLR